MSYNNTDPTPAPPLHGRGVAIALSAGTGRGVAIALPAGTGRGVATVRSAGTWEGSCYRPVCRNMGGELLPSGLQEHGRRVATVRSAGTGRGVATALPAGTGRGARLIPPAIQEEVRSFFCKAGWNEEVHFDGYVEDYDW